MSFEEDYSWLPSLEDPLFEKGHKYHIKSNNNWETYEYVGFDPKHEVSFRDREDGLTYPVFIFKGGHGTSYKSESYVEELLRKGLIKYYDPDFNFYNELKIKKINLKDIKPNFIIVFKNGVDVKDTYGLQKELFKMGYKWVHKGKKLVTDEEVEHKIFTLESLNWDTSNRLYSGMNATFGDRKILILSTFKDLNDDLDKERRLNFILDHPKVTVIDGDDLITKK